MKTKMLPKLGAFALSLALPAMSWAAPYGLDPDHTQVGFKVKHMVVTDVRGSFKAYAGTIDIDDQDVTKSKVNIEIDAASVTTGVEKRDGHLKSPDFFDVAKFPKLTFKSTKVKSAGTGKLEVTGDLTIRGVTKSVVLQVEGPTAPVKNPWGVPVRVASATTKINRKDFGLVWNKPIETGGLLVGDEVTIEITAELNPAK
ncbi:MAG: YceI family protein [Deltaproteobacteria bacterium]|nr:YceI family protein [Deltaproteobacteria bacterium]